MTLTGPARHGFRPSDFQDVAALPKICETNELWGDFVMHCGYCANASASARRGGVFRQALAFLCVGVLWLGALRADADRDPQSTNSGGQNDGSVSKEANAPVQYNMKPYFWLHDGLDAQYAYEVSGAVSDTGTGSMTISGPSSVNGASAYNVRREAGGVWLEDYMNWSGGFLRLYRMRHSEGGRDDYPSNPAEVIMENLDSGASNERVGDGGQYVTSGDTGSSEHYVWCYGMKSITVPAGTFDALHIKIRNEWEDDTGGDSGRIDSEYWLLEYSAPARMKIDFRVNGSHYITIDMSLSERAACENWESYR